MCDFSTICATGNYYMLVLNNGILNPSTETNRRLGCTIQSFPKASRTTHTLQKEWLSKFLYTFSLYVENIQQANTICLCSSPGKIASMKVCFPLHWLSHSTYQNQRSWITGKIRWTRKPDKGKLQCVASELICIGNWDGHSEEKRTFDKWNLPMWCQPQDMGYTEEFSCRMSFFHCQVMAPDLSLARSAWLSFHYCRSLSLSVQGHLTLWSCPIQWSNKLRGYNSKCAGSSNPGNHCVVFLCWGGSDNELSLKSRSTEQGPTVKRCWHFLFLRSKLFFFSKYTVLKGKGNQWIWPKTPL